MASLLLLSWVVWIATAVALHLSLPWQSYLPAVLTDLLTYGKLKRPSSNAPDCSSPSSSSLLSSSPVSWLIHTSNSVPRRYFTHFYVWGFIWNSLLLVSFALSHSRGSEIPGVGVLVDFLTGTPVQGGARTREGVWSQQQVDVLITLVLLCLQTFRRMYENFFVTVHSDRKMHAVHYVLGIYFYTAVGLTAMLHLNHESASLETSFPLYGLIRWRHVSAGVLFLWASYHQFTCHTILANLRRREQRPYEGKTLQTSAVASLQGQESGSMPQNASRTQKQGSSYSPISQPAQSDSSGQQLQLGIPEGDWFQHVSSPHYFAEVIIYCSLLLVEWGSTAMLLPCVFVVCVLTLRARQTHTWYCRKFDDYPKSRRIIFPYLF